MNDVVRDEPAQRDHSAPALHEPEAGAAAQAQVQEAVNPVRGEQAGAVSMGDNGAPVEKPAEPEQVETVATCSDSHMNAECGYSQPEAAAGSNPRSDPPLTTSILAQPLDGMHSAATAITSAQLTPVSVMLVLVMSTFTALGAAMYAVIKIMQPSLKATEKAAKAMELAAKDLQVAAKGMKQTSDMFQADVPVLFADIQTTSKEFSELGQTLNVVSGGWVGPSKSKKQDGPEKESKSPSRANGASSSYAPRPSTASRPSSVRGGTGSTAVARSKSQPANGYNTMKQLPAAEEQIRKSSGDSVGESSKEEAELKPQGWYGGTVSTLMRMTRDANKLGDVISPTVSSLRNQLGGIARVFNSKHRAEEERRQRVEGAQQWISDWRVRTGVKHVTHLPPSPSATAAGSPESSKPDSPTKIDALKQSTEQMVANLSATAVFDQSFREQPQNGIQMTGWLGWDTDFSASWGEQAEPIVSGFDISYKDIINSAEELALAGGSRTAASHLLGKLVQEQDPDLPFLTSTQGNLIMSFDDDDDYFERETYIDNVTLVDDRLLVGSDFSVARLHARKHTSSSQHKSGSGSTSTSKSKSLDRERKRRA